MSKSHPHDPEPIDPSFERLVERAMRTCGWLLPTTVEDVRRAEAELRDNPIPLPDRLRDPFLLLDRHLARGPEAVKPSLPKASSDPWLLLPQGLMQLAREVGLTIEQATNLQKMGRQVIAHRSSTKKDEMDLEDWRKFYAAVEEFL